MKFKKTIYICFLLAALQLCVSCEKMLDVKLPDNQIPSGLVFEDVNTANAAVAGLYAGLWESAPLAGDQSGRLLGMYTDDLVYHVASSNNGFPELYAYTHVDSNPAIYTFWSSVYQKIYLANSILEGMENSTALGADDKSRISAEVLTIRSLLFLYLQQIFGDVPYAESTDYQLNRLLGKLSSAQMLEQIGKDLNKAIPLMADQYRNAERIYINRKVAELVRARVYMQQSRWAEAEILLKGILQSSLYQFQNDLTKVFLKSETHILWQLKPRNAGDATKEASAYYFVNAVPTSFSLTDDLVRAFATGDLRFQHWIAPVTVGANTWYRANKYKVRSANTTEYSIVFRLEEVYLLLSEALARQEKIVEALPYVNKTRQRAGLTAIGTDVSQTVLLQAILDENRREFFTEMGHRFIALKRFGQFQSLSTIKPNWKKHFELWPIPQKDLLLNNQLYPQNLGY